MKISHRYTLLTLALSLAVCGSALAADNSITVSGEHTNFSNDRGDRTIGSVEYKAKAGAATFVIGGAHGRRDYGNDADFSGSRIEGSLYYDWNDKLSTRTYGAWGTNDPVFADSRIGQTFYLKLIPRTVFQLGVSQTEYFGDVDMRAYTAGVAYYFDRVTVSYRHNRYDVKGLDRSNGNVVSLRLKDTDGRGNTQLWLGDGTTVHDYEFLEDVAQGDRRSVMLRRVQPVGASTDINFNLGKTWYERPIGDYQGLQVGVGVTVGW